MIPPATELAQMSLMQLRRLDIRSADEEALVQAAINAKTESQPVLTPVYTGDVPDIKNKEQEEHWQKIVDERKEAARPRTVQMGDIVSGELNDLPLGVLSQPTVTVTLTPSTTTDSPVTTSINIQAFCQFCDSKGVRHKKACTRPQ